jgi:hypothetical protein
MRKMLLVTAVAALAAPAFAADYNNEVDVGILSLAWGNFNARYERNLNDYISLAGGGGFSPNGYMFVSDEGFDWKYYNVNGNVKFYPLGTFRGLFIQGEVNVDFHDLTYKHTGETAKCTMVMPGVVVGWRWVVAERATITLGAGSDYAYADLEVGDEVIEFEGIRPRFDFNLGFLF